jgi:hypothetical protein
MMTWVFCGVLWVSFEQKLLKYGCSECLHEVLLERMLMQLILLKRLRMEHSLPAKLMYAVEEPIERF